VPSQDSGGRGIGRSLDIALLVLIGVCALGLVLGRVVPLTGHTTFVVAGGSMEPAIPLGSAVVVEPVDPRALVVGDVVSLRSGSQRAVFTHRIVRIAERDGEVWVETKGDANPSNDPSITPASAIVGRVIVSIPLAGFLIALLSIPSGVLFVVSLGLLLLIGSWTLERPREPVADEDLDVDDLDLEPNLRPVH